MMHSFLVDRHREEEIRYCTQSELPAGDAISLKGNHRTVMDASCSVEKRIALNTPVRREGRTISTTNLA
jgi:hypothetical protein